MNSMLKNALFATLVLSAGSTAPYNFVPCCGTENTQGDGSGYWAKLNDFVAQATKYAESALTQAADYARTNTPEWIAQTGAYLAQMPKPVENASLYGYATADNAKNVLAKAGAVAVVAAATYGMYKCINYTKKKPVSTLVDTSVTMFTCMKCGLGHPVEYYAASEFTCRSCGHKNLVAWIGG